MGAERLRTEQPVSLISELKVGDRVKMLATPKGKEGVVIAINEMQEEATIQIEGWVGGHSAYGPEKSQDKLWVWDNDVELIPPTPVKAKKKTPKGQQAYKGNGKHKWELVVVEDEGSNVHRLRVPGGWLYRDNWNGLVFVPVPEAVGYVV
jgi:hypothetical protein